jgi:hypothetical protein
MAEKPPLYKAYQQSGSKLRYSRWLAKLDMPEKEIKAAVEAAKDLRYTVSTSYKDILRCSITSHYSSCYRPTGCNSEIPQRIAIEWPSVGIVYTRDSKGDFSNRFFIQLGYKTLKYPDMTFRGLPTLAYRALTLGRPYGELEVCKQIAKDLQRRVSYKIVTLALYVNGGDIWRNMPVTTPFDLSYGWTTRDIGF